MTPPAFLTLADPFGRPFDLRPDEVAVIEGAIDPSDDRGDLWRQHPITPYRRLVLRSGFILYAADHDAAILLAAANAAHT